MCQYPAEEGKAIECHMIHLGYAGGTSPRRPAPTRWPAFAAAAAGLHAHGGWPMRTLPATVLDIHAVSLRSRATLMDPPAPAPGEHRGRLALLASRAGCRWYTHLLARPVVGLPVPTALP